ncbi:MAG: GHKL domain-containing protein [Clostridium sp.]|nr:GHKL domain-containing protein [Clostridium sp.]
MKLKFGQKLILSAVIITFIPLVLSYGIFIQDKMSTIDKQIKVTLKDTAFTIIQNDFIKEDLYYDRDDNDIQDYTKTLISNLDDVDIIVICDMTGKKYSHLDEAQIGEIFVNPDKEEVLSKGTSYYSLMEGSMGETLRWFEPIMYKDQQVGFIMIGKYYSDILGINKDTSVKYIGLFILAILISIAGGGILAEKTKKDILNMEPEEIATLYNQKKIIINTVQDGIIALNKNNEVTEINNRCYTLFNDFSCDKVIDRLSTYIEEKGTFKMKELIIDGKKIFVTLNPIIEEDIYLGQLIILSDREDISKIAKEITGVDELIKNLRANVHEFKNNLHVILGLIQLKQYSQAKDYILQIQKVQEDNSIEFLEINDYYVRALLLSRKLVAKERKVELILDGKSNIYEEHGIIDSKDLVTILGNLIENALEACAVSNTEHKKVEVYLKEDDYKIQIIVKDNGNPIEFNSKEEIFTEGISSKGDNRGTGLYLVKNRVELYNGTIYIDEQDDEKIFTINILKGE